MSSIVQEVMAQMLVALINYKKEDLLLLLSEADFHHIAANEPKFMTYEKNLAVAENKYFMGIQILIVNSRRKPEIIKRIC